ncbi:Plasmodium vivax Vir protein, putative [Plasmodium vivax]|uniref:Vir protein, putative n=1 Tax=Plasmodium vivax TaxID=5855 RepID=A0A1G4EBV5_PLAVI|nr:Plasmodium vivax Vir protein, putative [Plasmodium vivax]
MTNYRGDNDVDILNTKYYYGKLDMGKQGCQNYAFYDKAKTVLDRYNGLHVVSDKILKALCYVYMNSLWSTLDSDLCNFLYFWLGNILLEKLNANFLFHEVILYLFDTLIDDKYQKICKLPHSLMLKKDFENFKLIFDCSQGYKSYSKHLLSPGMSCSNKYKSYLDTDTNNYKRFYNECEVQKKEYEYCSAFTEYFPDKKSNLLSQFNCTLETKNPTVDQLEEGHKIAQVQPRRQQMIERLQQQQKISVVPEGGVSLVEHPSSSGSYLNTMNSQTESNSLPSDDTPSSITSKIYSRWKFNKQIIRKNNKNES